MKLIDTTGVGDFFAGCFACAIAEGRPLLEAVRFANAGAGSTTRIGTAPAMAQRAEIDALLAAGDYRRPARQTPTRSSRPHAPACAAALPIIRSWPPMRRPESSSRRRVGSPMPIRALWTT